MNISKLNPIGYEAKTAKGNSYKKSNLGKSAALATGIGLTAFTNISTNPIIKAFSKKSILKDLSKELGIKTSTIKPAFVAGAVIIDLLCYYLFGSWIDKYVNSKREIKADKV